MGSLTLWRISDVAELATQTRNRHCAAGQRSPAPTGETLGRASATFPRQSECRAVKSAQIGRSALVPTSSRSTRLATRGSCGASEPEL